MRPGLGELGRCGAVLFVGYVALFLLLHTPDPARVGGAGLLSVQPAGYLQAAEKLNPIQQLNLRLGARGPLALQIETLAVLAFIFWAYLRATQVVRNNRGAENGLKLILGGVALLSVPLLLLPYILSTDVYNYVMFGRIAAIYGDNPMIMPPSAYPQDPFLKYASIHHLHEPAVYGPVWLLFSHALTLVVERLGGALWLYVAAYKVVALAFHLVSAFLIWKILGRWKPQRQLAGTLLYAWNPLALIEFAGSGHNDPLMISLILLAIWLALRSGWRLATVALAAAILIKWIPALLLSLYALLLLRGQKPWPARLLVAGQVSLLAIVTVVLLYAPYWEGGSALSVFGRNTATSQTINSLGDLAIKGTPYVLYMAGVGPHPDRIQSEQEQATFDAQRGVVTAAVKWVSRTIAVLAWLAALAAIWRWPTFERWLETSFWMLLIILLFAAIWFWPWYATWPLALASLLEWHPAGLLAVAFTATGLASYTGLGGRVPELIMIPPVIVLLIYLLVPLQRRVYRYMPIKAT